MNERALKIVSEARQSGRETYAEWNPRLFHEYCEGPADALWSALCESKPPADDDYLVLQNYLRLVQEGIGSGYLRQLTETPEYTPPELEPGAAGNVLEICFSEWVPQQLSKVKRRDRNRTLTSAWNLCEGVLREPEWVSAYVVTRAEEMTNLSQLDRFLVRVLKPVISASESASWSGGFETTVLDPVESDRNFLPGTILPLASRVVSIEDRRSEMRLGVLLQKSGQSCILGPISSGTEFRDIGDVPIVETAGNVVRIGGASIDVPFLNAPMTSHATASGFVVLTAVDSQRIWVIESKQ